MLEAVQVLAHDGSVVHQFHLYLIFKTREAVMIEQGVGLFTTWHIRLEQANQEGHQL